MDKLAVSDRRRAMAEACFSISRARMSSFAIRDGQLDDGNLVSEPVFIDDEWLQLTGLGAKRPKPVVLYSANKRLRSSRSFVQTS